MYMYIYMYIIYMYIYICIYIATTPSVYSPPGYSTSS